MKKRLAAAITTALVVGVASTTFAAANPFVDVPAKHWSYDAVAKLAQAGIVDGYGDGTYRGDRTITRYEMAQIVAKAMTKSDKADAQQKAALDKLAVEYSAELNNLGVRVAKLEANQSNIKFTGQFRVRYDNHDFKNQISDSNLKARTRIGMTGAINDNWSYVGRFEATSNLRDSGDDTDVRLNNAYVVGNIGGAQLTAGRFDYIPAYGLVVDSALDGAKVSFGSTLKATLYYGKDDNKANKLNKGLTASAGDSTDYYGAELSYKASNATNLVAAYHHVENAKNSKADREIWEVGFDSKIVKNLVLTGNYADSNEDDNDTAWMAGLKYKAANIKNKGSFDIFGNYRHLERGALLDTTMDGDLLTNGSKGFELGFNYVPAKNIKVLAKYADLKDVDNKNEKDKYVRAQVEFFF